MPWLGPKLMGQAAFDAAVEQEKQTEGGWLGPKLQRKPVEPAPAPVVFVPVTEEPRPQEVVEAAEAPEVPSLSLADMSTVLEKNPALVDRLMAAEEVRPGGMRRGALKLLRSTEDRGRRNPELLERLDTLLAE